MDSDDDSRRHCLDDVPGRLHTIEMEAHADVAGCCRLLSSFVDWTGDVALPHCCCWGAQWVVAVVERVRDVVVVGTVMPWRGVVAVDGGG